MKAKKIFVGLLLIFAVGILFANKAPDFTVELLDGKRVTSASLLAKGPIFLDFWFTGCKPCQLSLPIINSYVKRYPGLNVVTIATDPPRLKDNVANFVKRNKFEFMVGYDGASNTLQNLFKVRTQPHTIIIDRDGTIVYNSTGFNPGDEAKYEEILDGLFK
jgi:thiol-disulfide isomerase/thioredoxin